MSKFRIFAYTYLFTMLALLFAPLVARAQALPSLPPTGFPYSQVGNAYTFTGGTTTAANAASLTFSNAANGAVYAQSTQSLPLGGGYSAGVNVRSFPSAGNVAKAIVGFAGKVITPLVVGKALWDLAKELGFGVDNSGGTVVVTKPDPMVCTVGPCYTWRLNTPAGGLISTHNSSALACAAAVAYYQQGGSCVAADAAYFNYVLPGPGGYIYSGVVARTTTQIPPTPDAVLPSTMTELEAAIAAKSGWPSGSAVGRAVADAVASGVPLELPAPSTITGPATVPMAPSITNYPDGSQDIKSPQKNLEYSPSSVTVTDRTVTTHKNPDGSITPVQDTDSPAPLPAPVTPAEPIEIETCGLPGKPMCSVDGAGAPTGEDIDDTAAKKTLDPIKDFLEDPSSLIPDFPTINWSFALPTACTVIPVTGALATFLPSIDVCQFQPMFHDIMSMVWMLGGLFGAISLFMRSSLSD